MRATDPKRIRQLRIKLALAAMPITADDMPRRATKAANKPEQAARLSLTVADHAFLASMQARVRAMQPMLEGICGRHAGVRSGAPVVMFLR